MNDVARFTENLNFQPQSSMNNGSVPGSMDRSTNLLKANGQFGSISGIDQASMAEVSRITALQNMNGVNVGNTSKGDVTNLMMYLQDGEEPGVYLHDMGDIDDTERSNLIIDKDTNMVFDSRKEVDLIKIEKRMSKDISH